MLHLYSTPESGDASHRRQAADSLQLRSHIARNWTSELQRKHPKAFCFLLLNQADILCETSLVNTILYMLSVITLHFFFLVSNPISASYHNGGGFLQPLILFLVPIYS